MPPVEPKINAKLLSVVRKDINSAVVISKLNTSKIEANMPVKPVDHFSVVNSTNEKIRNNDNILLLFPDIEMCIQILSSSVLSPNNTLSTTLTYSLPTLKLLDSVKGSITELIKTYLEKTYKLETKLNTIFREAFFTKGAWIEAIISEAAVDDTINRPTDGKVNMDNYNKLAGESLEHKKVSHIMPSKTVMISNEEILLSSSSLKVKKDTKLDNTKTELDLHVEITDDITSFVKPHRDLKDVNKLISKESFNFDVPEASVFDQLFKINDRYLMEDISSIPSIDKASRESFGAPLVFKLPVEAVIPVHVINDPTKHLGYFVALDDKGSPISLDYRMTEEQANNIIKSSSEINATNHIINRSKAALHGYTEKDPKLSNLEEIYSRLIDESIRKALENGDLSSVATIKENADIYRVMFFRALRAKRTKLLYLPAESVAFYAFDYRENGTGRSYIEKTAMLHSIRSILLFSKVMANIKNSVTTTNVDIKLDDEETDPQGVLDLVKSEVAKTRAHLTPYGVTDINDIVSWSQSAGIKYSMTGGGLPDMQITTSDSSTSKTIPDDTLDELIRSQIYMAYGLSPDIVESGYAADFATTVVAKNLLFAKRTNQLQVQLNEMITSHMRKLILNDAGLKNKISKLLENNIADIKKYINKNNKNNKDDVTQDEEDITFSKLKDGDIVNYLLKSICLELECYLPTAELTEAQSLHDAFNSFKTALEENIDAIFPAEIMSSELIGELGNKADVVKGILKSVILRNWMAENNYIPELAEFVTKDERGSYKFNAFGSFTSFVKNIGESIIPFLKEIEKLSVKMSEQINNITNTDGDDPAMTDGTEEQPTDGESNIDEETPPADQADEFTDDYTDPEEEVVEEPLPEEKKEEEPEKPIADKEPEEAKKEEEPKEVVPDETTDDATKEKEEELKEEK